MIHYISLLIIIKKYSRFRHSEMVRAFELNADCKINVHFSRKRKDGKKNGVNFIGICPHFDETFGEWLFFFARRHEENVYRLEKTQVASKF